MSLVGHVLMFYDCLSHFHYVIDNCLSQFDYVIGRSCSMIVCHSLILSLVGHVL